MLMNVLWISLSLSRMFLEKQGRIHIAVSRMKDCGARVHFTKQRIYFLERTGFHLVNLVQNDNVCTADLVVINNNPNGTNINVKCGSTDMSILQKVVQGYEADFGLAFDGDDDIFSAVNE